MAAMAHQKAISAGKYGGDYVEDPGSTSHGRTGIFAFYSGKLRHT